MTARKLEDYALAVSLDSCHKLSLIKTRVVSARMGNQPVSVVAKSTEAVLFNRQILSRRILELEKIKRSKYMIETKYRNHGNTQSKKF